MIVFEIDDIKVSLKKEEELSILEAAKLLGINIPRFCFHDTLSIAGNCRMCLIKLEIPNKPDLDEKFLVSCITRIGPNMRITVNDPIIKKVREEILEFLLLNHPLDCPICDQAGECDLQDQTNFFGSNKSKFYFNKTSINDKNFGVFIKSVMTRCIYCTRCVRFSSEIAGVDFFGTVGRGKHTEISTHPYGFNFFNSELSGNVVDLCPVGALTLKSYSFKARPWELKTLETIDLTDAIGSNVYVNFNENGILRVAPKINSQINNTIITDKARFSYDAFSSFNSLVELKEIKDFKIDDSNSLIFQNLIDNLKKEKLDRITAIISEELSFESLNLLKTIESIYPNFHVRLINSYLLNKKENINYNLSNRINNIALFDKNIFLICTNPRTEVSLINARLRFVSQKDYYQFYYIGFKNDKEFKNSFFLNFNSKNILNLVQGKAVKLNKLLIESLDSCFLIGASIKSRGININIFSYFIKKFNPRLTIFSFLNNSNSFATNFLKIKSLSSYDIAKSKKIFFLNCRETVFLTRIFLKISFLNKEFFWLNSNKLNFLFKNGFQIPIKNIFEESGVYLNLEGLPQKSNKIVDNKSNALSNFSFFSYIFSIKNSVFKNNFFIKLFLNDLKKFNNNNEFIYTEFSLSSYQFYCKNYLLLVSLRIYKPEIINFFQSNYFTDFSKNLLSATQEFQKNHSNFFN